MRATHARPAVDATSSVTVAAVGGRTDFKVALGLGAGALTGGNADTIAKYETGLAAEAAGIAEVTRVRIFMTDKQMRLTWQRKEG